MISGRLRPALEVLRASGVRVQISGPGLADLRVGAAPPLAHVIVKSPEALTALERLEPLHLAEHYLQGAIDVEGNLLEVTKLVTVVPLSGGAAHRARLAFQLL